MTQGEFDTVIAAGSPGARVALLMVAAVCGLAVMMHDARRWPLRASQRVGVFAAVFAGGFFGAYVPALFAGGLVGERVATGRGVPMSILGGLAFSFLAVAAYKKSLAVDWDTSDAFARGTCLMMAIGRLGCHASHCCLGVKTSGFGMDFGDHATRVPIQLVEAGAMFVLFTVFCWLEAGDRLPHRRLFAFFATYGGLRFVLEFWREPMGAAYIGLGAYQWFALALVALGVYQVIKRTRKRAGAAVAA